MPTYEYACEACKHTFEQVQSMTASPLKKCPKCGKLTLERLVSGGSGFILKGAGFWRNDSKSRNKGGARPTSDKSGKDAAAKARDEGPSGAPATPPAPASSPTPAAPNAPGGPSGTSQKSAPSQSGAKPAAGDSSSKKSTGADKNSGPAPKRDS